MNAQELFGKRIKELRKKNKLTQEELSEMLGVFPKQVGNIETGTTFTTMNNIEKIKKIGPCPIHRKTFIKNFCSEE